MAFRDMYVGVRVMETSENYALADKPLGNESHEPASSQGVSVDDDGIFWRKILENPRDAWGKTFGFYRVYLTEWVARVPGLFVKPESEQLRRIVPAVVEARSGRWTTYTPMTKSAQVIGGVGTLRLAPAENGSRLAALTTSMNASAGIPALVSPAVWDKFCQKGECEGRLLEGAARWQAMDDHWAARFPSTSDIPRGYLVLDNPNLITAIDHQAPIQIHPFTIMEYTSGAKELFDFVYAQADTGDPNFRGRLRDFFAAYKDAKERYGRYLLQGDMVDQLWEADFNSPAELRRADPAAKSELELLQKRVEERQLGQNSIEMLLEKLAEVLQTPDEVRTLSEEIQIKASLWYAGGSVAEVCSQFLAEVLRRDRKEALIEKLGQRHPELFNQ